MKSSWKKVAAIAATCVMASTTVGLAACGKEKEIPHNDNLKQGTYRTYTAVMPSNWNELTYQDNNDTQIMSYIGSSFFDYDYEFDEKKGGKFNKDGTVNAAAIVDGGFVTEYSAATKLKDVTSKVDDKWGYTKEQKKEGGYAWEITLRDDLKWDDGTVINADSFVYSMQEQLNPLFLNYRANTYYQTLIVKNAKKYFYKESPVFYETIGAQGYESNQDAVDKGADIYVDAYEFWGALGYTDENGNECPQWLSINDTTVYDDPDAWEAGEEYDAFSGKDLWDYYLSPTGVYADLVEVGGVYESFLSVKVENKDTNVKWEDVGFYKSGEHSVVICMDKSYQFIKDDGDLSYLAAYYMSSLPLVKKDLYEKCKQAPQEGSTLWTSNYNSSKDTTASWGPYKLSDFQGGKSYTLERNDNWYGYSMNTYANQYNVTKITCEKIEEPSSQWLAFLSGTVDDIGLDSDHIADYMYSKYTTWSKGTGTYAMQLYGNLPVLKNNGRNNGILAIQEFRKAFSLSLNRYDVVEKIWPGSAVANFGAMCDLYYYDIENGKTYRGSEQAQKALLRVYGFTENADGTWSSGTDTTKKYSLDDAYDMLSGYDVELAREYLKTAIDKLTADPDAYGYDASQKITLIYGSSANNAKQLERVQYLQEVLDELAKGTALEGKFEVKFQYFGSTWSDDFKAGSYDLIFGAGFTGNALNPFDMIGAFVDDSDSLNYHSYWKTSSIDKTFTMPKGKYEGAGETITMSIKNWYDCLNGYAELNNDPKKYNWDAGKAPEEVRLEILAMLEEAALEQYYSVMLIAEYSGSLLSPKFTQISSEYNLFMGFGGLRYMTVNYTDSEWTAYVASQGGTLENEYKKTN